MAQATQRLTIALVIALIAGGGLYWHITTSDQYRTTTSTPTVEETQKKLDALVANARVEDPEHYSYLGCGIIHGPDGVLDNWDTYDAASLATVHTFLERAASQYTLIKLDYSQNPNPVSDRVQVVTCSCEAYDEAKKMVDDLGLQFQDLLWHTQTPQDDPMTPCLGNIQFG